MHPPAHKDIHEDMTRALKGKLGRDLTSRAEKGLHDFIEEAVIKGVVKSPASYAVFKEYLKCRFEHIAMEVDRRGARGKVQWKELIDAGQAEVRRERQICDDLIDPTLVDREGLRRKICEEFDDTAVQEATDLDDTP